MSEDTNSATAEATKPKKPTTEVTQVKMTDGRVVAFAGKRRMVKDYSVDADSGIVSATFDFVNGETRSLMIEPGDSLYPKFVGHGILQKVGDETAGDESVDDMVVHVDAIMQRLGQGEWGAERAAGDGFAGASLVIRAIMEAAGKDQAFVKAFIEKKLEADKAAGGSLTRQKLYASFRAPGTKTAPIIERLEKEKKVAAPAVDADAELEAMGG